MKPKTQLSELAEPTWLFPLTILFLGMAFLFTGCFLKQDRTTTIYGTITDQNQQPVDSIWIIIQGVKNFQYVPQQDTYTDKNGNFEIVLDVSKNYSSLDVAIPFVDNPKFTNTFLGFSLSKDGAKTSDCCFASIGQKTKYDFQLIPK